MTKWRVLVALILVIGVVGALWLANMTVACSWASDEWGRETTRPYWSMWARNYAIATGVCLFGSWILAWWVWRIGSRKQAT
ncbi:MAG: hypothetical protein H6812_11945 [Phycisphaeraceae bacterium]|nr:hypothetical protein [Phycisphaerales bacterium]MCB9843951.1 hypothetical protein [Phycisphaeraceae bacterium]